MSLNGFRKEIDALDEQIVQLLRKRVGVAREIGATKAQVHQPVYDPAREANLFRRIYDLAEGEVPQESLHSIYAEIISACRAVQSIRAAYLGPAYTNTYLAAVKLFGTVADLRPCRTVEGIFDVTERGETQLGVVPIENSINGVVGETCDCLLSTSLKVCAQMFLPVHHSLLAHCMPDEISVVYSHPQVFAQCRDWIRDNLPTVEQIVTSSTAAAAERAAREEHTAALAPSVAAEPHGLKILAEKIEDRTDNRTRFYVVGPTAAEPTGRDRTSIVFSVPHRSGSLHRALSPLDDHGINMTMIQSRPARDRLWEYVFFVDFEGHIADPKVQVALEELEKQGPHVKIIGSYPAIE